MTHMCLYLTMTFVVASFAFNSKTKWILIGLAFTIIERYWHRLPYGRHEFKTFIAKQHNSITRWT